jgi:putative SOS response-associated peptidase YedK
MSRPLDRLSSDVSEIRIRFAIPPGRSMPNVARIRNFAIVTTTPNEACAELHNRMPVLLAPAAWLTWLGERPAELPALKALLAPYPSHEMIAWPVRPARRQCQKLRSESDRARCGCLSETTYAR